MGGTQEERDEERDGWTVRGRMLGLRDGRREE